MVVVNDLHALTDAGLMEIVLAPGAWGVLSRDLECRLLNVSRSGCLIESPHALPEGTTGALRVGIDDTEYSDPVRVTRCQAVQGAGATFRIGVEFLWISAPGTRSLRTIVRRLQQETGSDGLVVELECAALKQARQ